MFYSIKFLKIRCLIIF